MSTITKPKADIDQSPPLAPTVEKPIFNESTPSKIRPHRYAMAFPEYSPEQLRALADNIKQHGLIEPIICFEGAILDGWHRFRACEMAGVEPRFVEFNHGDPIAYIVRKNLGRMHMNDAQRALVVAAIAPHARGGQLAKERCRGTLAALLNVKERSVRRAARLLDTPLAAAVRDGRLALGGGETLLKHRRADLEDLAKLNGVQLRWAIADCLKTAKALKRKRKAPSRGHLLRERDTPNLSARVRAQDICLVEGSPSSRERPSQYAFIRVPDSLTAEQRDDFTRRFVQMRDDFITEIDTVTLPWPADEKPDKNGPDSDDDEDS